MLLLWARLWSQKACLWVRGQLQDGLMHKFGDELAALWGMAWLGHMWLMLQWTGLVLSHGGGQGTERERGERLKGSGDHVWNWQTSLLLFFWSKQVTDLPRFKWWETHYTSGLEKLQNHIVMSVLTGRGGQSGPFFVINLLPVAGVSRQQHWELGLLPSAKHLWGGSCYSGFLGWSFDPNSKKPVRPVLQPSFMHYSFGVHKALLILVVE